MSQKKKGFTLVEVIVVMLVATLVFTMVGGTMVFVTTTTGDLIQQAEDIEMAKNIEKYLRALYDKNETFEVDDTVSIEDERIPYKILKLQDDGDLVFNNETVVFSNTNLEYFRVYSKSDGNDNFIRCYIKFKTGRQFDFIIGAK